MLCARMSSKDAGGLISSCALRFNALTTSASEITPAWSILVQTFADERLQEQSQMQRL